MSKKYEKLGSNIEVKGLIIHQVIKDAGTRKATAKEAKKLLKVEEKEKSFLNKINTAYFTKSGPTYGIFGDDKPEFKTHLKQYLKKGDFYTFSQNALKQYNTVISDSVPATGGFLIFAHFLNTEKKFDYMLVMTTNNKNGYMVSETDLTIKDIKNIELSKVDVACMINLTKWKEIENGSDTQNKTYLSFARGNKGVSYYFKSFIDCSDKTTSTESTTKLINALNDYYTEQGYDRDTRIKKRNEIFKYCNDCITNRKEIQLTAISAMVDIEEPDAFSEFASDEKYSVSDIISGDRAKLKTMKYISFDEPDIKVQFDMDLITKERIIYDRKKNRLTIKNVPESLREQIPE